MSFKFGTKVETLERIEAMDKLLRIPHLFLFIMFGSGTIKETSL
jgi:hypothetical protein